MTAAPWNLLCESSRNPFSHGGSRARHVWRAAAPSWYRAGRIFVKPAPSDLPFRWLVAIDGRERPAISIVAVLRQVRETLDPGYATRRVRIGAFPLVPP